MKKLLLLPFLVLTACSLNNSDRVTVSVELPRSPQSSYLFPQFLQTGNLPEDVSGFTCYGVNVMGFDIPARGINMDEVPPFQEILEGSECAYPGETSHLISPSSDSAQVIDVNVPAGPDRVVQVVGIQSEIGCPEGQTFTDIIQEIEQNEQQGGGDIDNIFKSIIEIGRAVTDLFSDTTVNVYNTYDFSNPKDVRCNTNHHDEKVLDLAAGFMGHGAGAPFTIPITDFAWPPDIPSHFITGTGLASADIEYLKAGNAGTVYFELGGSGYVRADLVFNLSGIDYYNYSGFNIDVRYKGQSSMTTCPGSGEYPGVEFRAYKYSENRWSLYGNSHMSTSFVDQTQYYSYEWDGVPAQYATPVTGIPGAGPFIYVSVSTTSNVGTGCSRLELDTVRVRLN